MHALLDGVQRLPFLGCGVQRRMRADEFAGLKAAAQRLLLALVCAKAAPLLKSGAV
jgi:hypothetical protein